jgi:hypothetical protein
MTQTRNQNPPGFSPCKTLGCPIQAAHFAAWVGYHETPPVNSSNPSMRREDKKRQGTTSQLAEKFENTQVRIRASLQRCRKRATKICRALAPVKHSGAPSKLRILQLGWGYHETPPVNSSNPSMRREDKKRQRTTSLLVLNTSCHPERTGPQTFS